MQDVTLFLVISTILNYLLVYSRIRYVGSILFIVIGLASYSIDDTNLFSYMIIIIGFISFLLEFTPTGKKK